MAIAFVNFSSAGGSSTSVILSQPAGMAVGNLMIASVGFRGNLDTLTPPAGWTLIRRDDETTHHSLVSYYRIFASGDPASWTWTIGTASRFASAIVAYSGVSSTSPIDAHAGAVVSMASTTITVPSASPTFTNDLSLAICLSESSGVTITQPTGFTDRTGSITAGGSANAGCTMEISDKLLTASGATGTFLASQDVTRDSSAQQIDIKDVANEIRLLASCGVGR